ncbi:DUF1622 domain-containing protein [Ramlibacter rhizophilus]|nr:DUF1622 domain-containing protein [Ramlibacter rhizophilus]
METIKQTFGVVGSMVEAVGVAVILLGFTAALAASVPRLLSQGFVPAYQELRTNLGRSLILGLEFLIAGDIIRTVTFTQTLESAAVLAVIVVIRVLLALTLDFEMGDRPFRRGGPPAD